MTENEITIKCENLSACYYNSKNILNNLSFYVKQGSFNLLSAPNGFGKTTLFRILRGLSSIYNISVSGLIMVNDQNPLEKDPAEFGKTIGIVFQNPLTQVFNLKVFDEISSSLILLGVEWDEVKRKTNDILNILNINKIRNRIVYNLSYGELQKTIISSILILQPKVLLFDESLSYLDPQSRDNFLRTLEEINNHGVTIIMTSHRIEEEAKYADNLIVFQTDAVIVGSPEDLIYRTDPIIDHCGFLKLSYELWKGGKLDKKILSPDSNYFNKFFTDNEKHSAANKIGEGKEDAILSFQNVCAKYPFTNTNALDGVNFKIFPGITTIIGTNGSGKSTIAKCCLRLVNKNSGQILISGQHIDKIQKRFIGMKIGYVPQNPKEMFFCSTVIEEILFGLKRMKISSSKPKAHACLEAMAIHHLKDRDPGTLSSGEQRRLSIAIALASEPELMLIMDEPEYGLDGNGLKQLVKIILDLNERNGISIVIITQDIETFLPLSDNTIVLKDGRVCSCGRTREIITESLMNDASLKLPSFWTQWKRYPKIKTWSKLAEELCSSLN